MSWVGEEAVVQSSALLPGASSSWQIHRLSRETFFRLDDPAETPRSSHRHQTVSARCRGLMSAEVGPGGISAPRQHLHAQVDPVKQGSRDRAELLLHL